MRERELKNEKEESECVCVVSSPDPTPHEGKRGLGTLVEFLGILNVSGHVTITYSDPLA